MSLLPFLAVGVLARRAVARALEMHVSLPARPAATKHKLLPIARKIDNGFIFDFQFSIFSAFDGRRSSSSASQTIVPTGTLTILFAPARPAIFFPIPCPPFFALMIGS